MHWSEIPSPLVVMVGPTAVGKTAVSIQVAERLGAEIISADSRLFYRGMDIGTAKPSWEEMQRVPHHLVDVASPCEPWSLVLFQDAARQAITGIHARHRLPILVGGTGQYVQAVIEGWHPPSQPPDDRLRSALEAWASRIGPQALHDRLAVLDAEAAASIDPRNLRRTVRALEVILHSGRRFSAQRRKVDSPYSLLQIGLMRPRQELYQRIDARIQSMLENGFVDEVRSLLAQGCPINDGPLSAIGYRELAMYLQGLMTLEDAVIRIKRLTRQFVRRQSNWFKESDPCIRWFQVDPGTADAVLEYIQSGEGWVLPGAGK